MLLTENEIKLANSDFVDESDSGDLADVESKIGEPQKRTIKKETKECPECGETKCICESEDIENEPYNRDDLQDILRELDPEEFAFVKEIIETNLEDFCQDFRTAYKPATNVEELCKIIKDCCEEDKELLGHCILYVYGDEDSEEYDNFVYADVLGTEISERLIDPRHIRKLRLQRKKASWKMAAKKRARFRKTGEGRIMKRKAKIYMKRYSRRKKQKLKRYGKELTKFNARQG